MTLATYQALIDDFVGQAFGLPIAHENAAYVPTQGTAWVALRVFENEILPVGLNSVNDTTGVLQFTLYYPDGAGAFDARSMADTIFSAYPVRRLFARSGQQVEITGTDTFDAAPENGWFKLVGRINYRAFV